MAPSWALLVLWLSVVVAVHLDRDDLAYVKRVVSRSHIEMQATDGTLYIRAVTADVPGPLKCTLSRDGDAVAKLLADKNVIIEAVGETTIRLMKRQCAELHRFGYRPRVRRNVPEVPKKTGLTHAQDLYFPPPPEKLFPQGLELPFPPEKTGFPQGPGNSLLIIPGTKWCGESNVATDYDDLGSSNETDACCRAHDQCPYFIGPFQTKYHHRNMFPWTLSLCDCDAALYHCLRNIKNLATHEVGKGFFGVLDVKCFAFKTGQYCSKYHWSQLWCQQNATGPTAVVQKLGLRW